MKVHLIAINLRRTRVLASFAAALLVWGCGNDDSSAADPHVPVTEGFPLYGPGEHWIDAVAAGTVTFEAAATVAVDLNADGTGDLTVEVRGPTTVFRSDSRAGDAAQPDHRSHLDLEIIAMELQAEGIRFRAGDGSGNFTADGPLFSLGRSDEIAGSPQLAADHFEIFFEGEIAGIALHNAEPLLVEATIDRLPPIDNLFRMVGPPLPLLNESGESSGVQIVSVEYVPSGEPADG